MTCSDDSMDLLIALAARTRALFASTDRNHTEVIREIFDNHDLVQGVWVSDRDGTIEHAVLKGAPVLSEIVASGIKRRLSRAAIPCSEAAEAEAMRLVFGDGMNSAS